MRSSNAAERGACFALAVCASIFAHDVAGAQTATPRPRATREDPSRPGRAATRVGWFVRGSLGIGYNAGHATHGVETRSDDARGIGRIESRYRGGATSVEALGAVRVARGLIGLAFLLGHYDGEVTSSPAAKSLALAPVPRRTWWLMGPMGGVQFGSDPSWLIGGTTGLGMACTGFVGPDGTEVTTRVDRSMLGFAVWGGPAWPLGGGLMLGLHARAAAMRGDVTLFEDPDSGTELALLVDLSFQSP